MYKVNQQVKRQHINKHVAFVLKWGIIIGVTVTLAMLGCMSLITQDLNRELTSQH